MFIASPFSIWIKCQTSTHNYELIEEFAASVASNNSHIAWYREYLVTTGPKVYHIALGPLQQLANFFLQLCGTSYCNLFNKPFDAKPVRSLQFDEVRLRIIGWGEDQGHLLLSEIKKNSEMVLNRIQDRTLDEFGEEIVVSKRDEEAISLALKYLVMTRRIDQIYRKNGWLQASQRSGFEVDLPGQSRKREHQLADYQVDLETLVAIDTHMGKNGVPKDHTLLQRCHIQWVMNKKHSVQNEKFPARVILPYTHQDISLSNLLVSAGFVKEVVHQDRWIGLTLSFAD